MRGRCWRLGWILLAALTLAGCTLEEIREADRLQSAAFPGMTPAQIEKQRHLARMREPEIEMPAAYRAAADRYIDCVMDRSLDYAYARGTPAQLTELVLRACQGFKQQVVVASRQSISAERARFVGDYLENEARGALITFFYEVQGA